MDENLEINMDQIHKMEKSKNKQYHEEMTSKRPYVLNALYKHIRDNADVFFSDGSQIMMAPERVFNYLEYDLTFYKRELNENGFDIVRNINGKVFNIIPYDPERQQKIKRALTNREINLREILRWFGRR